MIDKKCTNCACSMIQIHADNYIKVWWCVKCGSLALVEKNIGYHDDWYWMHPCAVDNATEGETE